MRGRKPKPTKVKAMEGNPGKRPLNAAEPEYPAGVGPAPDHLDKAARDEWDRVGGMLEESGVATQADRAVLAVYCQAWSRWVRAEQVCAKMGDVLRSEAGGVYQNPYLSVANRAAEQLAKCAASLGLDPSSRSRVVSSRPVKTASVPVAPRIFRGEESRPRIG